MAIVCKLKKGDTIQAGGVAFKIIGLGESSARIVLTAPANDKVILPAKKMGNEKRTTGDCRTFAI